MYLIMGKKASSLVPPCGIMVKHIKTGEDVLVSKRFAAIFVMMTMADFSDQFFGFHDTLFDNFNGRLEFSGNSYGGLRPGDFLVASEGEGDFHGRKEKGRCWWESSPHGWPR